MGFNSGFKGLKWILLSFAKELIDGPQSYTQAEVKGKER